MPGPYKKGHFVKLDNGEIYRLVTTGLDGVDNAVVAKVTARLKQPDAKPGASVRIPEDGIEGIFVPHDDVRSFDKDKDTP